MKKIIICLFLTMSTDCSFHDVLNKLTRAQANLYQDLTLLLRLADVGDTEGFRIALTMVDPSIIFYRNPDYQSWTFLHYLAHGGPALTYPGGYPQKDIANKMHAIIAAGADINAQSEYGETPLHLAVWTNNPAKVMCLLHYQADPNISSFRVKHTALTYAINYIQQQKSTMAYASGPKAIANNAYIIDELLNHGASIEAMNLTLEKFNDAIRHLPEDTATRLSRLHPTQASGQVKLPAQARVQRRMEK